MTDRENAMAAIGDEINQCLQIIVTNAGNWPTGERMYPNEVKEAHECCSAIHKAVERAAAAVQRLALPAAPPEEPSDRERAKIIVDWFYMGHHAHRELMERIKAEFAAVRASTPTLTAEDVESMIRSALSFTDSQNPSQVSLSYARMAERGNAILAAKPQKGAE